MCFECPTPFSPSSLPTSLTLLPPTLLPSYYNFVPPNNRNLQWYTIDNALLLKSYQGMTVYLAVYFLLTEVQLLSFVKSVRTGAACFPASRLAATGRSAIKLFSRSVLAFTILPALLLRLGPSSPYSRPSPAEFYVLSYFLSESLLHASRAAYSCFLSVDSFSVPGWVLFLRFDAPLVLSPLQTIHALVLTTLAFFTSTSCHLFYSSWSSVSSSSCLVPPTLSLLQPSAPTFLPAIFLLVTLMLDAPPLFWISGTQARQEKEEGYARWEEISDERMDELHEIRRMADPALKKFKSQQRNAKLDVAVPDSDDVASAEE